jgi:hypothetical protein
MACNPQVCTLPALTSLRATSLIGISATHAVRYSEGKDTQCVARNPRLQSNVHEASIKSCKFRASPPDQRGNGEASEAVQNAPRLLGMNEIHVDVSWLLESLQNGVLRDFVEHSTLHQQFKRVQPIVSI